MQTGAASSPAAAFLSLGFRPFFLAATAFAVLLSLLWYAAYVHGWLPAGAGYPPALWHAHEMVFGYSLAVVSGFLLTAVRNWTGMTTLHGSRLAALVAAWLLARLLPFAGGHVDTGALAVLDCGFGVLLCAAVALPILRARLWRQMAVVSKLVLLVASNGVFYAGLSNDDPALARLAVFCGLYLLLSLVLMFARRVLPGFIERGVPGPVRLRNSARIDAAALVLFVAFALADLFTGWVTVSALLSAALALVHAWRLSGWHTPQLWRKPLLWVLYVAYAFVIVGFGLKALQPWDAYAASLAVHAFAYGGIGLMTAGMLSRVALGHTGRDVHSPPAVLAIVFTTLLLGALFRIAAPLLAPAPYADWVAVAALLWAGAFALLCATLLPIVLRPRVGPSDA